MNARNKHRFRRVVWLGWIALLGLALAGCPQAPKGPPIAEINERIAALQDCLRRSQGAVQEALAAGATTAEMASSTSAIAATQSALTESQQLLTEGKNQAAMDRVMSALEQCNKIEAMAAEAQKRAEMARQRAAAEALLARVGACLENANRAIESAEEAGATDDELVPAQTALLNAESAHLEGEFNVNKDKYKKALGLLKTAEMDCTKANDLALKAGMAAANRSAAMPSRYTVQRGDSLWGISASTPIYSNPFMWPLLYKANRDQIRDPDLIHPNQVFSVPRDYSQEEAATSIQRAKRRGPWRIGDGPDYYILEGVRR